MLKCFCRRVRQGQGLGEAHAETLALGEQNPEFPPARRGGRAHIAQLTSLTEAKDGLQTPPRAGRWGEGLPSVLISAQVPVRAPLGPRGVRGPPTSPDLRYPHDWDSVHPPGQAAVGQLGPKSGDGLSTESRVAIFFLLNL